MDSAKSDSRGFTLIASLLMLVLLSGFALGLLMMVNTEQRVGGNDLSNNYTYHAAEGAIEKTSSDLGNMFRNIQAPTAGQICALSYNYPTWDTTVTYPVYNVAPVSGCSAPLTTVWGPISSGPNQGLYAQIIPVTMNASAQRLSGETVSMTRTAEVALIPVFQFGVFSDSDLFFGRSPDLGFAGRVHTNGDLYLGVADSYNLVFGDKITAWGNVVRAVMDNNVASSGNNNGGTVMIPTGSGGCAAQMANVPAATPSTTCKDIAATTLGASNGSVVGGHGSAQNTSTWQNVSWGTYNNFLIDGNGTPTGNTPGPNSTGATKLSLPFVTGALHPYEIIRRPPAGESVVSVLGASRLANEAQIRVLFSDRQADLHLSDWNGDASKDVQLSTLAPEVTTPTQTAFPINGNNYYLAESACGAATVGNACTSGDTRLVQPPFVLSDQNATQAAPQAEWPLINGWLLVEAKWTSDGRWHGITPEWLGLGFGRGVAVPTGPGKNNLTLAGSVTPDTDMANAILYLQVQADRTGNGTFDGSDALTFKPVGSSSNITTPGTPYGANSQYNWYPINFYDAREGEVNDSNRTGTFPYSGTPTCTANGVMNAVELDIGNLKAWLNSNAGTGKNVDYATQNGYVLYFSDRRGMQYDPVHSPAGLLGAYGFEDTVNYSTGAPFSPDNRLEPANYNGVSPEDVEQWNDNTISTYGARGVGDAFGTQTTNDTDTASPKNPYAHRFACYTVGRVNRVTGARHVLKLVDGSLGNLPTMPPGNVVNNCTITALNPTGCGGFTVASENPVYIHGNYNSNCPVAAGGSPSPCTPGNTSYDQTWTSTTAPEPPHAAAAIIADAVTLLSNNWQDAGVTTATTNGSLVNPVNTSSGQTVPAAQPNRIAVTTYYRVAIAAGKTIAFSNTTQNPEFAFGMDGGVHNFLRFLEDWGGIAPAGQQNLYYKGSIVSLFFNTYATGTFKCCNLVYNPPNRQYTFDSLFSVPQNLPPGTPMFRNVDNLSYRQNYSARTN